MEPYSSRAIRIHKPRPLGEFSCDAVEGTATPAPREVAVRRADCRRRGLVGRMLAGNARWLRRSSAPCAAAVPDASWRETRTSRADGVLHEILYSLQRARVTSATRSRHVRACDS